MSELNIGDRVQVQDVASTGTFAGAIGTLVEVRGDLFGIETPRGREGVLGPYYFDAHELELLTPRFVNVIESRTIWVTLPGDNAGHKLTEGEARALFVQLEEIL